MDEKKMLKGRIVIGCLLLVFTAMLGVAVTRAWFKTDATNDLQNIQMDSVNNLFELRTSGASSNLSDLLINDTFGYASGNQLGNGIYQTDSGHDKIVLRLLSENDSLNGGLQPGERGTISFTIVPNQNLAQDTEHELVVRYKISVKGYYLETSKREAIMIYEDILANDETPTEEQISAATVTYSDLHLIDGIASGTTANDALLEGRELLNGHLLFFEDVTNSKYSGLLNLSQTIDKRVALNQTETVNISWIWPETFADIVDAERSVIAASDRSNVVQYVASNEGYFFSRLQKSKLSGLNGNALTSATLLNQDNYLPLSAGYNNADQVIGDNVQYVLIEISADGWLVDKE